MKFEDDDNEDAAQLMTAMQSENHTKKHKTLK